MIDYQRIIDALIHTRNVISEELDNAVIDSEDDKVLQQARIDLGMVQFRVKKLKK